ncbi:RELT-like protein 2 [Rhinatrema bivittatum]|uniref:RELT-like protein 2 n=1 Tax=Rhinatrema bivittatum TaxID=194408 RepID=UPI0011262FA3|nr:RELT-like protein 2 [Rhinatrema bivittatum]
MSETSSMEEEEETDPQQNPYMLFLLVLLFFIMGLMGFLICHVLKKKGYRCRTSPDDMDPETTDALTENQANTEEVSNEDTVERIVKCIIENEANVEALKQMLGTNEGEVPAMPSLCPHRGSQDAGPPHHHTVHLGSTLAPCIHCSQKKKSRLYRMGRSKDSKGKPQPGEVTVFSVGRFRVTHIGKKPSLQESQDDPPSNGSTKHSAADKEKTTEVTPKGCNKNGPVQPEHPQHGIVPGSAQEKGPKRKRSSKDPALQDEARSTGVAEGQVPPPQRNGLEEDSVKIFISKQKRRNSSPQQALGERATIEMTEIKAAHSLKNNSRAVLDRTQDAEEEHLEQQGQKGRPPY